MIQESKKNINTDKYQVFSWPANKNELINQAKDCAIHDDIIITLRYLKTKTLKILEAGSGLGRVVKYLYDLGFKDTHGIEINKDLVLFLNQSFPELKVTHGDVLNMPYEKESFDAVLSYGVIEHFPFHDFKGGPLAPMKAMFDILKPGGIAIVMVPSYNPILKTLNLFSYLKPQTNNFFRKLFKKEKLTRNRSKSGLHVYPIFYNWKPFFEYRMTKKQFELVCMLSGFTIIESLPTLHMKTPFKLLNKILEKIPFLHNHHHVCVLKK